MLYILDHFKNTSSMLDLMGTSNYGSGSGSGGGGSGGGGGGGNGGGGGGNRQR